MIWLWMLLIFVVYLMIIIVRYIVGKNSDTKRDCLFWIFVFLPFVGEILIFFMFVVYSIYTIFKKLLN